MRGMNVDENENGAEAIKAGVGGTGAVLRNNLIDHCFIEDTLRERESVSIKEGGLTLFRVTFSNTKDLSARHAVAARIEECVGMRRISLNGADHLLLNSEAVEAIEVRSGSFDGATSYEDIPDGNGDIYMSAYNNRIESSTGPLAVGHVAADDSAVVADGTLVANHDGVITTTEPATYEEVPPTSEEAEPVRLSARNTGVAGWSYCESR